MRKLDQTARSEGWKDVHRYTSGRGDNMSYKSNTMPAVKDSLPSAAAGIPARELRGQ